MDKRINKTLPNSYYDNIRVLGWVGYSIHKDREGGLVNWEGGGRLTLVKGKKMSF